MIKGSCLCGRVQYQLADEIREVSMCHCSQCQQAQGSAFVAVCPVEADKLAFTGEEYIKHYESSKGKLRSFCGECGSPLYSSKSALPNIKRLRVGSITTAFTCDNQYHIHTDSIAPWHRITDSYKQYPKHKTES